MQPTYAGWATSRSVLAHCAATWPSDPRPPRLPPLSPAPPLPLGQSTTVLEYIVVFRILACPCDVRRRSPSSSGVRTIVLALGHAPEGRDGGRDARVKRVRVGNKRWNKKQSRRSRFGMTEKPKKKIPPLPSQKRRRYPRPADIGSWGFQTFSRGPRGSTQDDRPEGFSQRERVPYHERAGPR